MLNQGYILQYKDDNRLVLPSPLLKGTFRWLQSNSTESINILELIYHIPNLILHFLLELLFNHSRLREVSCNRVNE